MRGLISSASVVMFAWLASTANAQVVVKGLVTGSEGKPLPTAQVQLLNGEVEPADSATLGPDGRFELRAPKPGLLRLQAIGPFHGIAEALILADRAQTISVQLRLPNPDYLPNWTDVRLSTSDANSRLNNTPLVRQPDQTYVVEVQSDAPELLLAVNGVVKGRGPLEFTGAAEYRCLRNMHCYAVAHPAGGKLRMVFDPSRLAREAKPAQAQYTETSAPVVKAGEALDRTEKFLLAFRDARQAAAVKAGKPMSELPKDPPPAEMVNRIVREIGQEGVALVRHARFIEYLAMVAAGAKPDRALVNRALDELTPASPLWMFPYANLAGQAIFATGEPENRLDYAGKIIDAQPTKNRKAFVALAVIDVLNTNGLAALAQPLVAKIRAEAGDLPLVKAVLGERIQPGKGVPPFRAPALDSTEREYTQASLKGRVYLIDFWATWCAPCIAEFPGLTKLYEQYRDRGFEILSYSIDSNRDVVRNFRSRRFAMPWLHAIDPQFRELQSPMAKDFEVIAIPRPVLIDANGVIIATDADCRGAKLEERLKPLLGTPPLAR